MFHYAFLLVKIYTHTHTHTNTHTHTYYKSASRLEPNPAIDQLTILTRFSVYGRERGGIFDVSGVISAADSAEISPYTS